MAGQLRRIHRLGGRKIAILPQVVSRGQGHQGEQSQYHPDDARPFAHLEFVNPFL